MILRLILYLFFLSPFFYLLSFSSLSPFSNFILVYSLFISYLTFTSLWCFIIAPLLCLSFLSFPLPQFFLPFLPSIYFSLLCFISSHFLGAILCRVSKSFLRFAQLELFGIRQVLYCAYVLLMMAVYYSDFVSFSIYLCFKKNFVETIFFDDNPFFSCLHCIKNRSMTSWCNWLIMCVWESFLIFYQTVDVQ